MDKPSFTQRFEAACLAACLLLAPHERARGGEAGNALPLAQRIRQPVALAFADGGRTVLAANRRSGSVSVIDAASRQVVAESDVGRGLSDLAALPDGRHLLAVDQISDELLLMVYRDRSIRVVDRVQVGPDPVGLVVSTDGSSCVVTSLWSRRLTFLDHARQTANDAHPAFSLAGSLELPFCPRELAPFSGGSRLVLAEAFGGRIAVVDAKRRAIESVRSLPAHNIRGLAFAPDGRTLLIAHQVLNRLAQTSFDDVHWGLLIRNHLRVVRTEALMKADSDTALLDGSRLFDLGDVGYGAGDPAGLAFDIRGNLIVALAGVDEVAIAANPDQGPRRVVVGRRPTAVAPSPDGEFVYVADTLGDTISVVAIATGQRPATISLGPRPEPTAADRGEQLFYSAKLSHDGWMSCQSCHSDGHTNNFLSDTLGDGSYGAPKRVPSLLGVAASGPWTWTGSMVRLEDQVRQSIATTMHGPNPSDALVADLTGYLNSLSPPSSQRWGAGASESTAVARGRAIFQARKCSACHAPPEYTSSGRYDVGLVDAVGNREFNPPSLRAVSRRDAFLHDGRARSLDEVFQKERHPRGLVLTTREIDDLVAFLNTL
jgi:YVTN family beta-propeller protein